VSLASRLESGDCVSSTDNPSNHTGTLGAEIRVLPSELMLKGAHGGTYLDVLQKNGVDIATDCGGNGTCGKCRIQFVSSPPDPAPADRHHIDPNDIVSGWRLACAHQELDRAPLRSATDD
jgi:Na+-transporting NADH:ubiquinone oxidoreductase subunit NqrF